MTEKSFNLCLSRFRLGDRESLEKIFNEYNAKNYSVALRILRNETWAEEVAANVIYHIAEYAKRGKGHVCNPGAWVYQITKYAAFKFLETERPDRLELKEEIVTVYNDIEDSDFRMDFKIAAEKLSDKFREYADLYFIYGLKYKHIAEKYGVSENFVKLSFVHIRKHLKKNYKK